MKIKFKKSITVLSFDPGTTNCSFSVLRIKRRVNNFKYEILKSGMISNTFTDMKDKLPIAELSNEIEEIFTTYRIKAVILERFMPRGFRGNTIELVNIIIGVILSTAAKYTSNLKVITAATWKNNFNRNRDLKKFYRDVNWVTHKIDAICIGLYLGFATFNQKPFKDFDFMELASKINNYRRRNS